MPYNVIRIIYNICNKEWNDTSLTKLMIKLKGDAHIFVTIYYSSYYYYSFFLYFLKMLVKALKCKLFFFHFELRLNRRKYMFMSKICFLFL